MRPHRPHPCRRRPDLLRRGAWLVLVPHLLRQIGPVWLASAFCDPAWVGCGLTPADALDALVHRVERFLRGGGPPPPGVVIFEWEEDNMQIANRAVAPDAGYPRSNFASTGDAKMMISDSGGEGREATTMEAALIEMQATADKVHMLLGAALARIEGPQCDSGPDRESMMAAKAPPPSPLVPTLVDRTRMLKDTLNGTLHFAANLVRHV